MQSQNQAIRNPLLDTSTRTNTSKLGDLEGGTTKSGVKLEEVQTQQEEQDARRSMYGYLLMMTFVFVNSIADSVSKILYIHHSDLGVFEMLFMRGVYFFFVLLFLIRGKIKWYLYDSVPRDMIFPLLVRVSCGCLAFMCVNQAIKHVPIVMVALFVNTMPLFCSLLGFLILGEKITKMEILCLLIAFYGIYSLLFSSDRASKNSENNVQSNITPWSLMFLILGPLLMASINISLRYMRKMHEYTTSTYSVIFSLFFYGILIATTESELSMFRTFQGYEHLILIFISLAGGVGMLAKTKALQFEMAGRLGILVYFSIIFTYFFDMIFIGTEFHPEEMTGVVIILVANILSAYMVFHKHFIKTRA
eukprot:403335450